MKILIVGGGGREHALAWKFSQDPRVTALLCAPSNAGISEIAAKAETSATDIDSLLRFVTENDVDLTVVAEEPLLACGIVDRFESHGRRIFGPCAAAAAVEGSKAAAKRFLQSAGVPAAGYFYSEDFDEAKEYLLCCVYPCVIKADCVTAGKAVLFCRNYTEALAALITVMVTRSFGNDTGGVIIEEMLRGQEMSLFAFCDGSRFSLTPGVTCYKRTHGLAWGMNTAGMGAVSPSNTYTDDIRDYCEKHIFAPVLAHMAKEARPFKGVLGLNLMIADEGVKVLGVNVRMGDPEAQVLLLRMKSHLLPVIDACIDGRLDSAPIEWDDAAAACVVLASGGYPLRYRSHFQITGLPDAAQNAGVVIFHSGTSQAGDELYTDGGRVLGVCATGRNVRDAAASAYEAASAVSFNGLSMRADIGASRKKDTLLALARETVAGRKRNALLMLAQSAGITGLAPKDARACKRLFVEKRPGLDTAARELGAELQAAFGAHIGEPRLLTRYDIDNISDEAYEILKRGIISDGRVDLVYENRFPAKARDKAFTIAWLPGQYDQTADYILAFARMFTGGEAIALASAKVVVLGGNVSKDEFREIKRYVINPVDSREAHGKTPLCHGLRLQADGVETPAGFTALGGGSLAAARERYGLMMSQAQLQSARDYFRDVKRRDPTPTEIKTLDAYWSDCCRHTCFNTRVQKVEIERGRYTKPVMRAYGHLVNAMHNLARGSARDGISLADVATAALKSMGQQGLPVGLREAATPGEYDVKVNVDVNGKDEPWLLMFRHRSNNRPTELEPYGGGACGIGAAARQALADKGYVYQAIRVSGGADPRAPVSKTPGGKLPARALAVRSALGASEYANQIGLPVGLTAEIFHEGFAARRLETAAVVGAAPEGKALAETPAPGDFVVILGGKSRRDNFSCAASPPEADDESSVLNSAGKTQKGNPILKRRLQRLIRKPEAAAYIKRAREISAGGVAMAASRLADGMLINLDLIPTDQEGMDGTALALSGSQECLAVVVAEENLERFIACCDEENVDAAVVARVTGDQALRMVWRGQTICELDMSFLAGNGAARTESAVIEAPDEAATYFAGTDARDKPVREAWLDSLAALDACSQKGLSEHFGASCGGGAVVMPFGGWERMTPAEASVTKIPVGTDETNTVTILAHGCDPRLSGWSPFHGAVYAVVEALAKITASGGNIENAWLRAQYYFGKPDDSRKWGAAMAGLLGSFYAQTKLGIPAIGNQDSVSGTYRGMNVPPTALFFCLCVADVLHICTPEFKKTGSHVVYIPLPRDEHDLPDFGVLQAVYRKVNNLMRGGRILAAHSVKARGLAEAVTKMCLGNGIGVEFLADITRDALFSPGYGGLVLEFYGNENLEARLSGVEYQLIARTAEEPVIIVNGESVSLEDAREAWEATLESVFPVQTPLNEPEADEFYSERTLVPEVGGPKPRATPGFVGGSLVKPRVCLPVFPATFGEDDLRKGFRKAGGLVVEFVLRTTTRDATEESMRELAECIRSSQIFVVPGGGCAFGGAVDASSMTAAVLRYPCVADALMALLARKGLVLGIGGGFQALLKTGLLPFGKFAEPEEHGPALVKNVNGRHIARILATRVVSNRSPWLCGVNAGDVHVQPASHLFGRFVAGDAAIGRLAEGNQIATVYHGENPNGSAFGIEGVVSPDGCVFGKTCRSDRTGNDLYKNIIGDMDQKLFVAGIKYFS